MRIGLVPEPFICKPAFAMFVVAQAVEGHGDAGLLARTAQGDEQKLAEIVFRGLDLVDEGLLIVQDVPEPLIGHPIEELLLLGEAEDFIRSFWGRGGWRFMGHIPPDILYRSITQPSQGSIDPLEKLLGG